MDVCIYSLALRVSCGSRRVSYPYPYLVYIYYLNNRTITIDSYPRRPTTIPTQTH